LKRKRMDGKKEEDMGDAFNKYSLNACANSRRAVALRLGHSIREVGRGARNGPGTKLIAENEKEREMDGKGTREYVLDREWGQIMMIGGLPITGGQKVGKGRLGKTDRVTGLFFGHNSRGK
jgi:hypothetical protein